MATVTLASHVEQFGLSGYKRPLSQVTNLQAPSVRTGTPLTVPSVNIGSVGNIPATSARPDQRVNVRVPVARACGQPLVPGQVAFVSRSVGKQSGRGTEVAPAFTGTHVLSLEHLNELMSDSVHHVQGFTAMALFSDARPRSLFKSDERTRQNRVKVFNTDILTGKHANHPLKQYALDGVVCTPSDDAGDDYGAPIGSSVGMCNVAVKGPAPVLTHRTLHDKMRAVVVAPLPQTRVVPDTFFLQPIDVLAKVYVVLVAELVSTNPTNTWKFQYELVTSSNVNTAHGFRRFTDSVAERNIGPAKVAAKRRIVLKVHELGRVVDTNFGSHKNPSIVVSVNVKPLEATRRVVQDATGIPVVVPLDAYNTFLTRDEQFGGFKMVRKTRKPTKVVRSPLSKDLFRLGGLGGALNTGDSATQLAEVMEQLKIIQAADKMHHDQLVALVEKTLGKDDVVAVAKRVAEEVAKADADAGGPPLPPPPTDPEDIRKKNELFIKAVENYIVFLGEDLERQAQRQGTELYDAFQKDTANVRMSTAKVEALQYLQLPEVVREYVETDSFLQSRQIALDSKEEQLKAFTIARTIAIDAFVSVFEQERSRIALSDDRDELTIAMESLLRTLDEDASPAQRAAAEAAAQIVNRIREGQQQLLGGLDDFDADLIAE